MLKRLFDIIFSLIILTITSPLLIIITIIIKLTDGGNVLYKAPRTGLNGKPFYMFKFRTMVMNADKIGASSTTLSDPRITKIGKFLRKYKLDELPQLINVLLGDMSIVGPRPDVKTFTDLFTNEEKEILSVKPGITDWASIWNSDEGKILEGSDDPDKTYMEIIWPQKKLLQLKYVKNNNLWIDLKIILLTIRAIFIK